MIVRSRCKVSRWIRLLMVAASTNDHLATTRRLCRTTTWLLRFITYSSKVLVCFNRWYLSWEHSRNLRRTWKFWKTSYHEWFYHDQFDHWLAELVLSKSGEIVSVFLYNVNLLSLILQNIGLPHFILPDKKISCKTSHFFWDKWRYFTQYLIVLVSKWLTHRYLAAQRFQLAVSERGAH